MIEMNGKKRRKHIYTFDFLRIVAAFLVILNHTIGKCYDTVDTGSFLWLFTAVMFMVCKTAVPLFLMTTGVLELGKDSGSVTYTIAVKKIIKYIFIIIVWSIIYYWYRHGMKIDGPTEIVEIVKQALFEKPVAGHLWYLYTLVSIYIFMPFLKKMTANFTNADYIIFITIWAIVYSLIPFLNDVLPIQISFVSHFQLQFFTGYFGYLIIGDYIWKKREAFNRKTNILMTSIGVATIIIGILAVSYKNDSRIIEGAQYILIVLLSSCLFYTFALADRTISMKKENRLMRMVARISKTTFGIYLMHLLVMEVVVFQMPFSQLISGYNNNIMTVLLFDLAIFIICSAVTSIILKIPVLKRIVS